MADDELRYGFDFSMTYNLKRIDHIASDYSDSIDTASNGWTVIGSIPLDKEYFYPYSRKGKLKTKKAIGDITRCRYDE